MFSSILIINDQLTSNALGPAYRCFTRSACHCFTSRNTQLSQHPKSASIPIAQSGRRFRAAHLGCICILELQLVRIPDTPLYSEKILQEPTSKVNTSHQAILWVLSVSAWTLPDPCSVRHRELSTTIIAAKSGAVESIPRDMWFSSTALLGNQIPFQLTLATLAIGRAT